jgi:UDP-2,3-diacylglucosamine pyrophosphatase LpxH
MKYKTIILSDIHLGSKSSRANDVIEFLEKNTTETLILNGDIVDGWALKRGGKWKESHTKVLRKIMKMSEKGVNVIWLRGNHDEFLKDFIPFQLSNLTITEDYTFTSIDGRKMYVFHGDVLDVFITKAKWLAHIGSIGYDLALWMNRVYNKYREMRGLPYYSISKDIKSGVKKAVNFINDFEHNAILLTYKKGCDVAVCGHIHQPELKDNYMNSGDWCENCTALVETKKGEWKIIEFHKK